MRISKGTHYLHFLLLQLDMFCKPMVSLSLLHNTCTTAVIRGSDIVGKTNNHAYCTWQVSYIYIYIYMYKFSRDMIFVVAWQSVKFSLTIIRISAMLVNR